MADGGSRRARRLSTPLVLASSSAMIAIGIAAFIGAHVGERVEEEERSRAALAALVVDDRSAEAVAESFLDAWRRRSWEAAARISVGAAHDAALEKRERDRVMNPEDREMAREVWERLASAPLEVEFVGSEELEGGAVALAGVASYDFMGAPYRREVRFEVEPHEGSPRAFRVRRMELGAVLTETPRLLEEATP